MTTLTEQNPLLKKLRIKAGQKALILEAPAGFQEKINQLEGLTLLTKPKDAARADLVLLFARDQASLNKISPKVLPLVRPDALLWIAYPKGSGKLKSDLNRDILYRIVKEAGLEGVMLVAVDETWSAMRFKPAGQVVNKHMPATQPATREIVMPEDFTAALNQHPEAQQVFEKFAYTHRKEYVNWITEAKKPETRNNRIAKAIELLKEGKKSR